MWPQLQWMKVTFPITPPCRSQQVNPGANAERPDLDWGKGSFTGGRGESLSLVGFCFSEGHVLNPAVSGPNPGKGQIEHSRVQHKQTPGWEARQTRQDEELETGTGRGADTLSLRGDTGSDWGDKQQNLKPVSNVRQQQLEAWSPPTCSRNYHLSQQMWVNLDYKGIPTQVQELFITLQAANSCTAHLFKALSFLLDSMPWYLLLTFWSWR